MSTCSCSPATGSTLLEQIDLTAQTRPTYDNWYERARRAETTVSQMMGELGWKTFMEGCMVMARLSDEGVTAYTLLAAAKPGAS